MTAWLQTRLAVLDRRVLFGMLAAIVLVLALEAWLLVVRSPLAEWQTLRARRAASERSAAPQAWSRETERLDRAIAASERELRAAAQTRSDDDTVLFLIGALGPVATRHGVALDGVRAQARRVELGFSVASFDVEARGPYLALSAWLQEAEQNLEPLTITELNLDATEAGSRVALKMRLTAYAPMTAAKGAP